MSSAADRDATEDQLAPFSEGVRVSLRQYVLECGELHCRELGLGEMVARPRLGEPLRIRIRAGRGLSSSRIQQMVLVADGRLAVVTNGRAYLLSQIESGVGSGLGEELDTLMEGLVRSARASDPSTSGDVTQYLRVQGMSAQDESSPFVGVPLEIERSLPASEEVKVENLGVGHLLAEPEPGLPLRLVDGNDHLLATSDVLSIDQDGEDVLEVGTTNSRYRLQRVSEKG